MLEHQNPWKQYALLLLGATIGLAAYMIAWTHNLTDVQTFITYNIDFYTTNVYVRIAILLFLSALLVAFLICLLMRLMECLRESAKQKKRAAPYVSEAEYEKQAKEATEREIAKLVNSEAYKKVMETKGTAPEKWNWQTSERIERENNVKTNVSVDSNSSEESKQVHPS